MSHTLQNILGIIFLAGVFILTRYGIGWKMKRAAQLIEIELKESRAYDRTTAVHLPWAKPNWLKFGMRDFRPKVLKDLVTAGRVAETTDGRFFILSQNEDANPIG